MTGSARDVINAACLNLNQRCDSTYATAVLEAATAIRALAKEKQGC